MGIGFEVDRQADWQDRRLWNSPNSPELFTNGIRWLKSCASFAFLVFYCWIGKFQRNFRWL